MRRFTVTLLGSTLVASVGIFLSTACPLPAEVFVQTTVPFDGATLGKCTPGETTDIEASTCPIECAPGRPVVAICVGTTYGTCGCGPEPVCPDSGLYPRCKGKVAMLDPSEGLCPNPNGYLLCEEAGCYSQFSCDLPDGYTVIDLDAATDAPGDVADGGGGDAPAETSSDGPADAPPDTPAESGDAGSDAPG